MTEVTPTHYIRLYVLKIVNFVSENLENVYLKMIFMLTAVLLLIILKPAFSLVL